METNVGRLSNVPKFKQMQVVKDKFKFKNSGTKVSTFDAILPLLYREFRNNFPYFQQPHFHRVKP